MNVKSGKWERLFLPMLVILMMSTGMSVSVTASEADAGIGHVLFLSSYNASHDSFAAKYKGLKDVFDGTNVVFDMEFLDSKRFKNEENYRNFHAMLQYRLTHDQPYDAIIVSDDDALLFTLEHQESLFKDMPIVFLGINSMDLAVKAGMDPLITGIVESISIKETISVAQKLNQKAKKVLALVDESISGQANLAMFDAVASEFPALEFLALNLGQYSFDAYKTQLETIRPDTLVIYLAAFQDKNGDNLGYSESISFVSTACPVPVFQVSDIGIGNGITGGYVIDFVNQGNIAAKMVLEILGGTPVSSLEVVTKSPNTYKFDYAKMKEFNLDKDLLPHNTVLLHDDIGLFERYRNIIVPTILVLVLQGFVIVLLIRNIRKRQLIEKNLLAKNEEIQHLNLNIITTLVAAIEAKDSYTQGHSRRVAEYAVKIAEHMGLSEGDVKNLHVAGILHDIGKIGISDDILTKAGPLTAVEYDVIKTHPTIGLRILDNIGLSENIRDGILYHHLRVDLAGYPQEGGLPTRFQEQPLFARIIEAADALDAMTSSRKYKKAMNLSEVKEELRRCAGTQFCEEVVAAVISLLEQGIIIPLNDI